MRNQYLGWFGLTENEKIAAYLYNITGNAALKDFLQEGGWNIALIKKLKDNYSNLVAKGYKGEFLVSALMSYTLAPRNVVESFITYKGGSIALQPSVIDNAISSVSSTAKNVSQAVTAPLTKTLDTMQYILIAGSVIGAVYLFSLMSKNVKD